MTPLAGWGRVPRLAPETWRRVDSEAAVRAALAARDAWTLRGLGRSYGDAALGAAVLDATGLRFLLDFDAATGELECEAGVSLGSILDWSLPRGWALPVVPGTRHVTVGGAIAADVHGKNHHRDGAFSAHLCWIELMLADGAVRRVAPGEPLFHAACGGMGLSGAILRARLRLERVASAWFDERATRCDGLEALLAALDAAERAPYVVAWLDCLARGARLGRGLVLAAERAPDGGLEPPAAPRHALPVDAPGWLLGPWSVRAFNALYWRARGARARRRVSLERYCFPLDGIADWNRLYGAAGFVQHQCVLPGPGAAEGLRAILARTAAAGRGSALAVLKRLGAENRNLLSFPAAGYTLALDFRYDDGLPAFLGELDRIVVGHGGRLYLAKDATMSLATFRAGYPRWEEFAALRASLGLDRKFASAQSRRLGL